MNYAICLSQILHERDAEGKIDIVYGKMQFVIVQCSEINKIQCSRILCSLSTVLLFSCFINKMARPQFVLLCTYLGKIPIYLG